MFVLLQGEKLVLLLQEDDIADADYVVMCGEFVTGADFSHMFAHEDQTTIINSIRTEVTQSGLVYSRKVAWNYFVRSLFNTTLTFFYSS